jgi:hypothetical protein
MRGRFSQSLTGHMQVYTPSLVGKIAGVALKNQFPALHNARLMRMATEQATTLENPHGTDWSGNLF